MSLSGDYGIQATGFDISKHLYCGDMPAEQLQISEALAAKITHPALLFWRYDRPAVIMGRSQRPAEELLERGKTRGLDVQQRGSGGGAVFAGPWMLSVTMFLPADHPVAELGIIDIFKWFEAAWKRVLLAQGISCRSVDDAEIAQSKETAKNAEVDWACYAGLSHGELVSENGRKLLGLAQIRKKNGVALVSGLHLGPSDWNVLADVVTANPQLGEVLADLNVDCQELSGKSEELLLPAILDGLYADLLIECTDLQLL